MPRTRISTGIDVHYEIEGAGPPLLLIMGTAADHTTWSAQVAAYREHFTVLTYDARGTGRSSQPDDPREYTMPTLADDAAALVRELGLGAVHVSGLSLGSATAQELAIRHPALVRAVSDGQRLPVTVVNEETGKSATVTRWGVRVPEAFFNDIRRDKLDNGIIEKNPVGRKQRGELDPRYLFPKEGGAITSWDE